MKKGLIIFFKIINNLNFISEDFTILTLFNYKKFICLPPLLLVLFLKPIVAEQLLSNSEILRKSNECFKDFQYKICNNLFLDIEKIQLIESERNRYKCQSSILGLQTELIEAYYFKNLEKYQNSIMIPYVIKNC